MRIPNINLWKYQKSYNKTNKVIRTITKQNPYIQKQQKQNAEMEREIQEYLAKQKEFDKDINDRLNKSIEDIRVNKIQYYALLLYGIKVDKEKILEILKARKAK